MSLARHILPWQGEAYRHIPSSSPYHPLDTCIAVQATTNRWNRQGHPTLYLAGDIGVLTTEFGRHIEVNRSGTLRKHIEPRTIYRVALSLDRTIDLRLPSVQQALAIPDAPNCWLDRTKARATAEFLRDVHGVHALLVPSLAFLDDPNRWNLVVFVDQLAGGLAAVVSDIQEVGVFHLKDVA